MLQYISYIIILLHLYIINPSMGQAGEITSTTRSCWLGFHIKEDLFSVLKLCLLIAKFYIYREIRFGENNILYIPLYNSNIQIEHIIRKKNNTLDTFDKFIFVFENL